MTAYTTVRVVCDARDCDHWFQTVTADVASCREHAGAQGWMSDPIADRDYCARHAFDAGARFG